MRRLMRKGSKALRRTALVMQRTRRINKARSHLAEASRRSAPATTPNNQPPAAPARTRTERMLINEPQVLRSDPILSMIASINGNSAADRQLAQGVYQVGHFGSSDFLRRGYEQYPNLGEHGAYGVCDGLDNLMAVLGSVLNSEDRKFVVTLTPVYRDPSNKGQGGGWRWHKWGEYIGAFDRQHEYLDDEEGIDCVYCYHVYERVSA